MSSVSFVTSTFNEEKNLEACLVSVKDMVDEMIVVDGSSSDKTVEIAKKFNARVLITDNPPIFLINRQKGIEMAKEDWILQLDADERLTPELREEIKEKVIKNDNKEINGYWIPRKNWFLGRYLMKGGVYPDYQLRLYRRGKAKFMLKDVHEQATVEGKTEHLQSPMEHLSDPVFSRYLMRLNRYTDRIADEIKEENKGFSPLVGMKYLFFSPVWWFLKTYIRHKGFMDSWQGFLFSFFSASRFPVAYSKFLKNKYKKRNG